MIHWDVWSCPQTDSIKEKSARLSCFNIFLLNIDLMSVYLNLSFVWCYQCHGIVYRPECYMINILKNNYDLIPILGCEIR